MNMTNHIWSQTQKVEYSDPNERRDRTSYNIPTEECRKREEHQMKNLIINAWNFIFNADVSPLRHIPDIGTRHYVLQSLGLMWAVSFAAALGSYTILATSIIGHAFLIGAAAITVATYTAAAEKPHLFVTGLGRSADGEHQ